MGITRGSGGAQVQNQVPKGAGWGGSGSRAEGRWLSPCTWRGSRCRQVWTDAGGQASAGAEGEVEVSGAKEATVVSDQD